MNERYTCHQCFARIDFDAIAHVDLYADLCWIQCVQCEADYGLTCGLDRDANPHPHGYLLCPLRVPPLVSTPPRGHWTTLHTSLDDWNWAEYSKP